jgi:hypothetical protein
MGWENRVTKGHIELEIHLGPDAAQRVEEAVESAGGIFYKRIKSDDPADWDAARNKFRLDGIIMALEEDRDGTVLIGPRELIDRILKVVSESPGTG